MSDVDSLRRNIIKGSLITTVAAAGVGKVNANEYNENVQSLAQLKNFVAPSLKKGDTIVFSHHQLQRPALPLSVLNVPKAS